jgi:hypothetical protein
MSSLSRTFFITNGCPAFTNSWWKTHGEGNFPVAGIPPTGFWWLPRGCKCPGRSVSLSLSHEANASSANSRPTEELFIMFIRIYNYLKK